MGCRPGGGEAISISGSLSLDLHLWISISGSLSLDLHLWISISGSLSLDLHLCISISGSLSLDLYLRISISGSLSLDLWISISGSPSLDLYLRISISGISISGSPSLSQVVKQLREAFDDRATDGNITLNLILVLLKDLGVVKTAKQRQELTSIARGISLEDFSFIQFLEAMMAFDKSQIL